MVFRVGIGKRGYSCKIGAAYLNDGSSPSEYHPFKYWNAYTMAHSAETARLAFQCFLSKCPEVA